LTLDDVSDIAPRNVGNQQPKYTQSNIPEEEKLQYLYACRNINHFSSVGFGHTNHYGHIFEGTSGVVTIRVRAYAPVYMCRSVVYKAVVAYPGILFEGGGGSTNSVEDRENVDLWAVAL